MRVDEMRDRLRPIYEDVTSVGEDSSIPLLLDRLEKLLEELA